MDVTGSMIAVGVLAIVIVIGLSRSGILDGHMAGGRELVHGCKSRFRHEKPRTSVDLAPARSTPL
jgi:hypothetical protein